MNDNIYSRTIQLIGEDAIIKLKKTTVLIVGIGGVGGTCFETLVRSGVGTIIIIDNDCVDVTNLNRQLLFTEKDIGKSKVDVARKRAFDINPDVNVISLNMNLNDSNITKLSDYKIDYIVDAIDTVTAKIDLVLQGDKRNIPVISSMGAGNKLNPAMFEVADIYKTSVCPLARVMRQKLKKLGIKKLKVVYSKEEPIKTGLIDEETNKSVPGSLAFVPSVAGLIIAGEVVKDLAKKN